jgi:pimeloyl-ACP methyl ester carboxylesterase
MAHPGFVPWLLCRGGRAEVFPGEDATRYAGQFRDPARATAASCLYRSYLRTARAVLLRHAFAGQRLQVPARLLFGADDVYIPLAAVEEVAAHADDLTLEIVGGCSHWMPEERPDLVADRARVLFG